MPIEYFSFDLKNTNYKDYEARYNNDDFMLTVGDIIIYSLPNFDGKRTVIHSDDLNNNENELNEYVGSIKIPSEKYIEITINNDNRIIKVDGQNYELFGTEIKKMFVR